ncbi:toll/interleukin-1 receptor domain-containing protein [bacterium]|nr:toll/interleukin-1 receptor domain-containing protein [bacterium]MBU4362434.1 toll/interleukin-1 receptor domain-containing protein [bacterium]MBU4601864.1 toll/interleukin-1 receptor domain-containing protein [bacterium]
MKVFISWSGKDSRKFGEALRDWLPAVLQFVKPYFTPSDVEKGSRWNSEIAKELESSKMGIICVTRENLHSDWVLFEAGALSKSLESSRLCPILFDIQNTDLTGPLKQFQTTEFNKNDFKKLVSAINANYGENKLQAKVLDSVFEKWWPELEAKVNTIFTKLDQVDEEPIRTDRDLLEEILELSRISSKNLRKFPTLIDPGAIYDLLKKYSTLHNNLSIGEGGYQEILDALHSMEKAIKYIANRYKGRHPKLDESIEELNNLTFKYEKQEDDTTISEDDIPF